MSYPIGYMPVGYLPVGNVRDHRTVTRTPAKRSGLVTRKASPVKPSSNFAHGQAHPSDPKRVWNADMGAWVRVGSSHDPNAGEMVMQPYPHGWIVPPDGFDVFGDDPDEIAYLNQVTQMRQAIAEQRAHQQRESELQSLYNELYALKTGGSQIASQAPGTLRGSTHGSVVATNEIVFEAAGVAAGATQAITFDCNRYTRVLLLTATTGAASFSIRSVKINGQEQRENLGANGVSLTKYNTTNTRRLYVLPWSDRNNRIVFTVRNDSGAPADVAFVADVLETDVDPATLPADQLASYERSLIGGGS